MHVIITIQAPKSHFYNLKQSHTVDVDGYRYRGTNSIISMSANEGNP